MTNISVDYGTIPQRAATQTFKIVSELLREMAHLTGFISEVKIEENKKRKLPYITIACSDRVLTSTREIPIELPRDSLDPGYRGNFPSEVEQAIRREFCSLIVNHDAQVPDDQKVLKPTIKFCGIPLTEVFGKPIGRILVKTGKLTREQVVKAIDEKQKSGRLIGQIFISHRWVTEDLVKRTVAIQRGIVLP